MINGRPAACPLCLGAWLRIFLYPYDPPLANDLHAEQLLPAFCPDSDFSSSAFFGPDFCCRIKLFPLDVWHPAERMFFARYAEKQHAERNSNDGVTEEKSHNALAQLSVSCQPASLKRVIPQRFIVIDDAGCTRICFERTSALPNMRRYKRLKEAAAGLLSDAVARTDRHSAWNEASLSFYCSWGRCSFLH